MPYDPRYRGLLRPPIQVGGMPGADYNPGPFPPPMIQNPTPFRMPSPPQQMIGNAGSRGFSGEGMMPTGPGAPMAGMPTAPAQTYTTPGLQAGRGQFTPIIGNVGSHGFNGEMPTQPGYFNPPGNKPQLNPDGTMSMALASKMPAAGQGITWADAKPGGMNPVTPAPVEGVNFPGGGMPTFKPQTGPQWGTAGYSQLPEYQKWLQQVTAQGPNMWPTYGPSNVPQGSPYYTGQDWYQQYGLTMPTQENYAGGNPHYNPETGKFIGSPGWQTPDPDMAYNINTGYADGWTPPGQQGGILGRGLASQPTVGNAGTHGFSGEPTGMVKGQSFATPTSTETVGEPMGQIGGVGGQPPGAGGGGQDDPLAMSKHGINWGTWGPIIMGALLGPTGYAIGKGIFDNKGGQNSSFGGGNLLSMFGGQNGMFNNMLNQFSPSFFQNAFNPNPNLGNALQSYFLGAGSQMPGYSPMGGQAPQSGGGQVFDPNDPNATAKLMSQAGGGGWEMTGAPISGPGFGGMPNQNVIQQIMDALGGRPGGGTSALMGNMLNGFQMPSWGQGGGFQPANQASPYAQAGGGGWDTVAPGGVSYTQGGPPEGYPPFTYHDMGTPGGHDPYSTPGPAVNNQQGGTGATAGNYVTGNIPSAEAFRDWVTGSFQAPINWQTMGPGGINEGLWNNSAFMTPAMQQLIGNAGTFSGNASNQAFGAAGGLYNMLHGGNIGLSGQQGIESLMNPAIQQAIGQGGTSLDQAMQHLFSAGFPGQGALSNQITQQLGAGGGIQGQTGEALKHLLTAGLPGQGPLSNFLNWGTDPAHLQAMSTGMAGAPNAVGAPGIQGAVENQLGGLIGGAGLSPEYVQAARQRYLEPQMEALKGRLNAQGGGQAAMDSGLFQELQRKAERDFMDQLLMQGQDKLGQYMGQGMQLGGQQFGQGMQNAQMGMQGGQQGMSNFLNAYGAIPQGGMPILNLANQFGQQGVGNAMDLYNTIGNQGMNLMGLANQRQNQGYGNLMNLYQGSAGTQLPFIQQMMQNALGSNQAANQNLQTYGGLTGQMAQDKLGVQNFMRQLGLDQYGMHSDNIARALQMYGMNQQQGLGQADIAASILRSALSGEYQSQAAGQANKGALIAALLGAIGPTIAAAKS